MPLSEHERKLLEQLETDFTAGTPRPTDSSVWLPSWPAWLSAATALSGVLAGAAIAVVGVWVAGNLGTVLGVFGYLATVGCCALGINVLRRALRRRRHGQDPAGDGVARPDPA